MARKRRWCLQAMLRRPRRRRRRYCYSRPQQPRGAPQQRRRSFAATTTTHWGQQPGPFQRPTGSTRCQQRQQMLHYHRRERIAACCCCCSPHHHHHPSLCPLWLLRLRLPRCGRGTICWEGGSRYWCAAVWLHPRAREARRRAMMTRRRRVPPHPLRLPPQRRGKETKALPRQPGGLPRGRAQCVHYGP
jgi:hypothetical protein